MRAFHFPRALAIGLATLLPFAASAAPLGKGEVKAAVAAYAKARGMRPDKIDAKLIGQSASGKSTMAIIRVGGEKVKVAINNDTGRVQTRETGSLVNGLLDSHVAYKRAGLAKDSSFASKLVSFKTAGGRKVSMRDKVRPVGRPRAGQSAQMTNLDALSLDGGAATLSLNKSLVVGKRGAGIRIKENGIGDASGKIINVTPGLVSVKAGGKWYRLGYAGYQAAGDMLTFAKALDKIPAGAVVTDVRVKDAPGGPGGGKDPTDDAVASARGVKGFDLVSVEGIAGSGK
jgi:hypothetical protein